MLHIVKSAHCRRVEYNPAAAESVRPFWITHSGDRNEKHAAFIAMKAVRRRALFDA